MSLRLLSLLAVPGVGGASCHVGFDLDPVHSPSAAAKVQVPNLARKRNSMCLLYKIDVVISVTILAFSLFLELSVCQLYACGMK